MSVIQVFTGFTLIFCYFYMLSCFIFVFKSPIALSLAILAGFLPQFVLGLFAGVYVDRWNRKKTKSRKTKCGGFPNHFVDFWVVNSQNEM